MLWIRFGIRVMQKGLHFSLVHGEAKNVRFGVDVDVVVLRLWSILANILGMHALTVRVKIDDGAFLEALDHLGDLRIHGLRWGFGDPAGFWVVLLV